MPNPSLKSLASSNTAFGLITFPSSSIYVCIDICCFAQRQCRPQTHHTVQNVSRRKLLRLQSALRQLKTMDLCKFSFAIFFYSMSFRENFDELPPLASPFISDQNTTRTLVTTRLASAITDIRFDCFLPGAIS